jgi:hypothetical protein
VQLESLKSHQGTIVGFTGGFPNGVSDDFIGRYDRQSPPELRRIPAKVLVRFEASFTES